MVKSTRVGKRTRGTRVGTSTSRDENNNVMVNELCSRLVNQISGLTVLKLPLLTLLLTISSKKVQMCQRSAQLRMRHTEFQK
jgi:hypothetical protein